MKKWFAIALIAVVMASGCAAKEQNVVIDGEDVTVEETEHDNEQTSTDEESNVSNEQEAEEKEKEQVEIDLEVVKPNETGQVMVVMYHSLGPKNKDYIRTVESFKSDLEVLYNKGYRPISMSDYVNNNIDIEAGMSPVVLTFDDGHVSNFNILDPESKTIDPDSVVGIMEAFSKEHPDFPMKATFYLNAGEPFKQEGLGTYKLKYLVDNGFEIGNHSYGHENFKKLNGKEVETSLGKNNVYLQDYLPEGYEVTHLALPFGSRPKSDQDKLKLISGSYEDVAYEHTSILNVGWCPEVPAIHVKFNPYSIKRVHSGDGEMQMAYWMDDLESNPHKKFISDGDPDIVTVPEERAETVNMDKLNDRTLRTY